MEKVLLGLLVGIAIGAGAVLLLDRSSPHEISVTEEAGTPDEPVPSARRVTDAPIEPTARDLTTTPEESGEVPTAGAERDVVGRVLEGILRDGDGAPIAGVALRAEAWPTVPRGDFDSWRRMTGDLELETWVAQARRAEMRRRTLSARAVSDEDGRFRFEILGALEAYEVRTDEAGWVTTQPGRTRMSRPRDPVEVVARRACELTLELRDENGAVPAQARVELSEPESYVVTWTPDRPTLNLPAGPVVLRAETVDRRSEETAWLLEEAAETRRLVLRPPPRLVLHADFAGPRPPRFAFQWLMLVEGEAATADSVRTRGRMIYAHGDEPVVVKDLDPGRCAVIVLGPEAEPLSDVVEVALEAGATELRIPARSPDLSEFVVVTVLGPDGEPRRECEVRLMREKGPGDWLNGNAGIPDGEGRHWVRRVSYRSPAGRPVALAALARDPRLGTLRVPLPENGNELTLRFAAPARLAVSLGEVAPEILVAARVEIFDEEGIKMKNSGRAGRDGTFVFEPLQPGDLRVVVSTPVSGQGARRRRTADRPVTVASGENAITVRPGPLARLTVRVPSVGEPAPIRLRAAGTGRYHHETTDESGTALFTDLEHGLYLVDRPGRAMTPVTVRVPDRTEVTLEGR